MRISLPRLGSVVYFLATAALAAGVLHILATLAAPRLATASAYQRLADAFPLNTIKVLPPITAENQPLPFMSADARYAICRFDTSKGPVAISARLPEAGWTLAVFSSNGDNLYVAAGDAQQTPDISLLLVPSDDRFMGLTPEAGGTASGSQATLKLAARKGLVVVRAPDRGLAYRQRTEADLAVAACTPKPF